MAKIKLNNGVVYKIEEYATKNSFAIILENATAAEVLETLTEENLAEIQFLTDAGTITGVFRGKIMCGHRTSGKTLVVDVNDADLLKYGIIVDETKRITETSVQRYAPAEAIIVDKLPEGNATDYLYVDGAFVYEPLPVPDPPTSTLEGRVEALEQAFETSILSMDAAYVEGVNSL